LRGDTGTFRKIGGATAPAIAGWPGNGTYGRIVLAIAPSADSILYALMWNGVTSGTAIAASMFRANRANKDSTWINLSANLPNEGPGAQFNAQFECFSGYCLCIAVKPNNPNFVVIGGVNVYKSIDGFATNTNYTRIGGYATAANYALYLNHHSDNHILVFQPGSNIILTTGNDGGLQTTNNVTVLSPVVWNSLNNNYQTYQYYYTAIDPTPGSSYYIGGAQDNGTTVRDSGTNNWTPVYGGDGASVGISCGNAFQYESSQNGDIERRVKGAAFQVQTNIKPNGEANNGIFVTLFYLDPDNTENLYYASNNRIWRTTQASTVTPAAGWTNMTGISANVTGNIMSLATTRGPYNPNHNLFMGTNNAHLWRLTDPKNTAAGTAPIDITPGGITAGSTIIGIAIGPRNGDTALCVVSNYNAISVFWTGNANAGAPNWRNVEGNLTLPSFRSCAIVVLDSNTYEYYVGTSVGLYSTTAINGANPGATVWAREAAAEMGEAVVSSLVVRPNDNTLLIGTHGNGTYVANIGHPVPGPMSLALTVFPFNCYGSNIAVTRTGGSTVVNYLWNDSVTIINRNGVGPGTWSVTATDPNGCLSATASVVTTQPLPPGVRLTAFPFPCYGSNIAVTGSGGSGLTTYMWNDSTSNVNRYGVGPGTYCVTATDQFGCTGTACITTTQASAPYITLTVFAFPCYGSNIAVTASGGTGFFTYRWNDSTTNVNRYGVGPGIYCVTATDSAGCTATACVTTTQPLPPAISLTVFPFPCYGSNIAVTATGGAGINSYIWNDSSTNVNRTAVGPGNYCVTATDSLGCTATACTTTTQPTAPQITLSVFYFACSGANIAVTTTGGSGFVTYVWNDNTTNVNRYNVGSGTYTVTGTDQAGCTGTATVVVNVPAQVACSATFTNATCAGNDGTITITATGGTQPYIYSDNGGNSFQNGNVFNGLSSGGYTVVVRDSNGCSCTSSVTISQTVSTIHPIIVANGPLSFCNGGSVSLEAGIYSNYYWSNGATTESINATSSGYYCITVSNGNACTGTACITVTSYPPPNCSITPSGPTVFQSGGSVTLDAGLFASYSWSNGSSSESILVDSTGHYCVTITDYNGCTCVSCIDVTVLSNTHLCSISASGPTSFCQGGYVILDAGSGQSYIWNNSLVSESILATTSGNYCVTITYPNGGSCVACITVTVNPAPAPPTSGGNVTVCANQLPAILVDYVPSGLQVNWSDSPVGGNYLEMNSSTYVTGISGTYYNESVNPNTGCISLTRTAVSLFVNPNPPPPVSGGNVTICLNQIPATLVDYVPIGFTVNWSDSPFGGNYLAYNSPDYITSIPGIYYNEAVSIITGCKSITRTEVILMINPNPAPPVSGGNVTACYNQLPATLVDIVPNGISVNWWDSPTGGILLAANSTTYTTSIPGIYYNEAQDPVTGCISTSRTATSLTVNAGPSPVITGNTTICSGGFTTLSTGAYASYMWSNSSSSSSITVTASGVYSVTVVDANGCTGMASTTVTIISQPPVVITATGSGCNGSMTLSAGTYNSYQWSTGATTSSITVTASGTYSVTVMNSNGCSGTGSLLVNINAPVSATITGPSSICSGGQATLSAGTFSAYHWSNGASSSSITITAAGTYSVTVTNANGCTGTATKIVTLSSQLTPVITASGPTSFCQGGSVTLTVGSYSSYNWSNGATGSSITVNSSGSYVVTVSNGSGCTGTTMKTVTVTVLPMPSINVTGNLCSSSTVTLAVAAFTTYSWSNGATTQTISVSVGGTYSVTVTNSNGCSGSASATVPTSSCVPPGGLLTSNVAGTTAMANWAPPACYVSYSIRISKHNQNLWTTYNISPNTHYTFSALSLNTSYDWQILTYCNASHTNISAWSPIQIFTTLSHKIDGDNTSSELANGLQVYPNPTDGMLNVLFNADKEENYSLKLMDVTGRMVMNENYSSVEGENHLELNLASLAKGIYFIQLQNGEAVLQSKIVVQ